TQDAAAIAFLGMLAIPAPAYASDLRSEANSGGTDAIAIGHVFDSVARKISVTNVPGEMMTRYGRNTFVSKRTAKSAGTDGESASAVLRAAREEKDCGSSARRIPSATQTKARNIPPARP